VSFPPTVAAGLVQLRDNTASFDSRLADEAENRDLIVLRR
jgi:hypothetical protein